jgi:hypothetical protein
LTATDKYEAARLTSTYGSGAVEKEMAGLAGPGWVDMGSSSRRSLALPSDPARKATDLQHCIREFLFKRKVDIGQTGLLWCFSSILRSV